ncbi:hypothetical protein SAMN05216371_0533 [Streptomyces sp. TLI_053]|nr:hypothetical protein SAMN05216371_0533 [Streptomyces sp. TLI_053]
MPGTITVGDWTVQQDSSGNLTFKKGRITFSLTTEGKIKSSGGNAGDVLHDRSVVHIVSTHRGSYLDSTWQGDSSHSSDWDRWAYFVKVPQGNTPNQETEMTLRLK